MFHPNLYWWRLVLTLRKLSEAVVALMLSSKPLFQAWYVIVLPSGSRPCRCGVLYWKRNAELGAQLSHVMYPCPMWRLHCRTWAVCVWASSSSLTRYK
jgi:hypothetical protein